LVTVEQSGRKKDEFKEKNRTTGKESGKAAALWCVLKGNRPEEKGKF